MSHPKQSRGDQFFGSSNRMRVYETSIHLAPLSLDEQMMYMPDKACRSYQTLQINSPSFYLVTL